MGSTVDTQKENKKSGFFQKLLVWIVIPLLLILFLTLLAATVSGVNVYEKAKEVGGKLPVISSIIGGKETVTIEEHNEAIVKLEAQIEEKNAKISRLERKVEDKESEIDLLNQDKKRLETTLEEKDQVENDGKREMKEIVAVYETMMPKRAASIIVEMKDEEAVNILSNLGPEPLARIMEKMPPEKAAAYTQMLAVRTTEGR
ncbi:MotE family protein [Siminovitchia fortis]|uniref:MotE family protein n=1 Tax=Siminovitchia fortis TaxID=254758 RepID=UPI0011A675F4|nr:MotE family protein [Siminovitchia fortis]